jgi:general stress protein 26
MADASPTKDLSDLVDGGTIAMLMTMIGDEHTSRPLTVAGVDGGRVSFLVDRTTDWATAIGASTPVHLSVSDVRSNTYLSLQGRAEVTPDASEVERLWNPAAAAFFDGEDDPAVGVLHFDVGGGEYWDSPGGRLGSAIAVVKAAVTGDPAGEHGDVTPG